MDFRVQEETRVRAFKDEYSQVRGEIGKAAGP